MFTVPRLYHLRRDALLSQRELAQRAGIRQATVSQLERGGMAHPATIRKLAAALGVEPGLLMRVPRPRPSLLEEARSLYHYAASMGDAPTMELARRDMACAAELREEAGQ